MARRLAFKGGTDFGAQLSAASHPCHAKSLYPEGQDYFSLRLFTLLHPPAHHYLANWMDNLGWLSQWPLVNMSSEIISPRNNCPCPEIFSIQNKPSFCCTSYYAPTFSLLHQSTLWLILNKSQHTALPQERPVLLEDSVLGKHKDYMQQSPIPIVPRRTLLLWAATPQWELHQQ